MPGGAQLCHSRGTRVREGSRRRASVKAALTMPFLTVMMPRGIVVTMSLRLPVVLHGHPPRAEATLSDISRKTVSTAASLRPWQCQTVLLRGIPA